MHVLIAVKVGVHFMSVSEPRNGVVRYESVMMLRNKLEELGKMKGVNQDEKGGSTTVQSVLFLHNQLHITINYARN